jgi:hypothetical protein
MFCVRCVVFYALAMLAGCSYQGPSLAGQPGLQWQVISFYGDRATERDSSCNSPQMRSSTATHVVDDTPERVVMDLRYTWVDESGAVDMPHGGSNILCQGWGERTFTFARNSDGTLGVLDMSGPQRRA